MAQTLPDDVQRALILAMDDVPLTAEQRRRILEQFTLRFTGSSDAIHEAVPAALGDSHPPAAQASLAQALQHALETKQPLLPPSTAPAAPPVAATSPAAAAITPQNVKKQLQSDLAASLTQKPAAPVNSSAVQALLRQAVVKEHRRRREGMSVSRGLVYSFVIGLVLAAAFVAVFVALFGVDQLRQPLILTAVDIFIVVILLQILGSLHEWAWHSTTHMGIVATLMRGVIGPISVPFGFLLAAHESLWNDYQEDFVPRLFRAVVSPVSVPVGVVWNASGAVIRVALKLTGKGPSAAPAVAAPAA